jgi:hypothetical protein
VGDLVLRLRDLPGVNEDDIESYTATVNYIEALDDLVQLSCRRRRSRPLPQEREHQRMSVLLQGSVPSPKRPTRCDHLIRDERRVSTEPPSTPA